MFSTLFFNQSLTNALPSSINKVSTIKIINAERLFSIQEQALSAKTR